MSFSLYCWVGSVVLSLIGSLANNKNTNFCRKWGGRSQDFPLYLYILSLCLNILLSTIFLFVKLPFTASTCISELVIYGPRSKHRGCVLRILTMHYCLLGKILPYLDNIQTHALSGLSFLRMLCFTWSQVVH
jgi:hypothetical protein